jgi:hypothetical protein
MRGSTGRRVVRRTFGFAGGVFVAAGVLTTQAGAAPIGAISHADTAASTASTLATLTAKASAPEVSAATTGPATCPQPYTVNGSYSTVATPPHIMEIVEENTSYSASDGGPYIIGNAKAPYINNTLIGADKYTSLTNWYSIEHNSPLDYMDLVAGCDHNGFKRPYTDPTLVNELDSQTPPIPWKAYMDGLATNPPQNCYTGHGSGTPGDYAQDHNPFVYFEDIIGNTTECSANLIPYPGANSMVQTLDGAGAPDFVWITPSQCDDMHSRCAPTNNPVEQGDNWLANNLPAVLASTWYTQGNGIIIITFDEGGTGNDSCPPGSGGTSCGGHILTLVISADSCGTDGDVGDNFSILRGVEKAYGVPYLNNSGGSAYPSTWNPLGILPAFTDGACKGSGGTGSIGGQVTSTQAGNPPLGGATVACTCSGTNAITNSSGNYSFASVPIGTYQLTVSDPGYVTQVLGGVQVTSGNNTVENFALAPQTSSPPAVVQDIGLGAQAAVTSFAIPTAATTGGDLLAISTEFDAGTGHASGSVIGVTDNKGDTWTRATAANPSTRIGAEVWYTSGAAAGVTSVNVTYSTSVNPVVRFYEISNASALDQASSSSGSSTGPNSGTTGVTTGANEVVIGDIGYVTTTASISGITAGYTTDALLRNPATNHQNTEQGGHQAVSSTGTFLFAGTLSSSQSWAAVVATFK